MENVLAPPPLYGAVVDSQVVARAIKMRDSDGSQASINLQKLMVKHDWLVPELELDRQLAVEADGSWRAGACKLELHASAASPVTDTELQGAMVSNDDLPCLISCDKHGLARLLRSSIRAARERDKCRLRARPTLFTLFPTTLLFSLRVDGSSSRLSATVNFIRNSSGRRRGGIVQVPFRDFIEAVRPSKKPLAGRRAKYREHVLDALRANKFVKVGGGLRGCKTLKP